MRAFESVFLGAVRLCREIGQALADGRLAGPRALLERARAAADMAISNGLRPGLAMVAKTLADELGPARRPGQRPAARPDRHRAGGRAGRRDRRRRARRAPRAIADDPAAPLRRAGGVRPGGGLPALAGRVVRVRRDGAGRRRACSARSERPRDAGVLLRSRSYAARTACLRRVLGGPRLLALGQHLLAGRRLAAARRAPLVVQQVEEAEDGQHAEEPPLQPVEEVRPVVELGQLGGRRGAGRPRGSRSSGPRSRRTPRGRWRAPISTLEIARVEWSVTSVLSPVASTRTQPVTVTSPDGGVGDVGGRPRPGCRWPSSRGRPAAAVPSAVTSGTTTSTPGLAVAGAVADHDGVVGVVGAGRGDHAATRRARRRGRPGASTSADRGGLAAPRCARITALLALRSARRWNCHSPSHQVAQASSADDEREEQPPCD